jgi:hypothetical protein
MPIFPLHVVRSDFDPATFIRSQAMSEQAALVQMVPQGVTSAALGTTTLLTAGEAP